MHLEGGLPKKQTGWRGGGRGGEEQRGGAVLERGLTMEGRVEVGKVWRLYRGEREE